MDNRTNQRRTLKKARMGEDNVEDEEENQDDEDARGSSNE